MQHSHENLTITIKNIAYLVTCVYAIAFIPFNIYKDDSYNTSVKLMSGSI